MSTDPNKYNPKSSFAVSYTLKNEERLLADAIRYHLALGANSIYCYFDGTTDSSREIAAQFPQVVSRETVRPDEITDPPSWIRGIFEGWENNMDRRKRINVWHSAQLAAESGVEWLFAIDVDELLVAQAPTYCDADAFAKILGGMPSSVIQILLPNLEVVPERDDIENPFRESSLFLNRFPMTEETARIAKAVMRYFGANVKTTTWFDYYFQKLRFSNLLQRLYSDPLNGEPIPSGYFLGYSNHKSAIRAKYAKNWTHNIHSWHGQSASRTFRASRKLGNILHYDLYSANSLRLKYGQRNEWLRHYDIVGRGRVAYLCMNLSEDAFDRFFKENFVLTDEKRKNKLIDSNIAVRINCISNKFQDL